MVAERATCPTLKLTWNQVRCSNAHAPRVLCAAAASLGCQPGEGRAAGAGARKRALPRQTGVGARCLQLETLRGAETCAAPAATSAAPADEGGSTGIIIGVAIAAVIVLVLVASACKGCSNGSDNPKPKAKAKSMPAPMAMAPPSTNPNASAPVSSLSYGIPTAVASAPVSAAHAHTANNWGNPAPVVTVTATALYP